MHPASADHETLLPCELLLSLGFPSFFVDARLAFMFPNVVPHFVASIRGFGLVAEIFRQRGKYATMAPFSLGVNR